MRIIINTQMSCCHSMRFELMVCLLLSFMKCFSSWVNVCVLYISLYNATHSLSLPSFFLFIWFKIFMSLSHILLKFLEWLSLDSLIVSRVANSFIYHLQTLDFFMNFLFHGCLVVFDQSWENCFLNPWSWPLGFMIFPYCN